MSDLYSAYSRLAANPVPSAFEAEGHALLRALLPAGAEISADNLGQLLIRRRGEGRRLLFVAHADASGIMASHIDKDGFVRFGLLGRLSPAALCDREVRFLSGLRGIIRAEKEAPTLSSELYIDIGARSRADAARRVKPGDPALLCDAPRRLGNRLTANYIDPALPGALLCALAEEMPGDADVTLCFSAAAEVEHGAVRAAAGAVSPELAILLDCSPAGDVPGADGAALGKGPVLRLMDKGCICSPVALDALRNAAEKAGISLQEELCPDRTSDAGQIQLSAAGIPTAILALPVRGLGSALQSADLRDARAALQVLRAMI
ncbi:MAG: hypothetical protein IKL89_06785 [Clostridia bacterium]|nr:hypothetical protein [Clostridia bacterium]